MDNIITHGDIVVLKSGSPLMTVNKDYGYKVECLWFNNNIINTYDFYKNTLIKKN